MKHAHIEVQKAGIRCLGLFGQLPTKASAPIVRQLRICLSNGIAPVQNMAIKSLFDLVLCHGAALLDRAIGIGPHLGPVPEPRMPGLQVRRIVHFQASAELEITIPVLVSTMFSLSTI